MLWLMYPSRTCGPLSICRTDDVTTGHVRSKAGRGGASGGHFSAKSQDARSAVSAHPDWEGSLVGRYGSWTSW
jgi:hypothetical protein